MNWALPWNSGVTAMAASLSVSRVRQAVSAAKKNICACGIATPLDGPVVPEVKKMEARERGETSGSSPSRSTVRSSHRSACHPALRSLSIAWSTSPLSITQKRSMSSISSRRR